MKVSKWNDKLKNHHNSCDLPFWNGFECCVNSLVPQTTKHMMVEWCITTMVLPICNEAPLTLNKGMGSTSPWTTGRRTKRQRSEECGSSSFPKHPLSLFKHCLGCLFTHSQPPFPFFQWVIAWVEKPTQVWWVCCFGKHLMMGVWMVLMSHNEPLHNHNTHHVCFPAFHSLCLPFTSTSHKWCSCDCLSNGVLSHSTNVMCRPHLSITITSSLLPLSHNWTQ